MFDGKTINIFSSRDRIRDEIIEYAKEYLELEGHDFSKTSYLSYLVNVLSVLTSNLLYYSTSIYKEFFITRAVQKESVLNLSTMLGYTPPNAVPAVCSVLVSIPISFSKLPITIEIPEEFKFLAGTIVFTLDSKTVVNINEVINSQTGAKSTTASVVAYPKTGGSKTVKCNITTNERRNKTLYFMVNVTQVEKQEFEFTIPQLGAYEFYNTIVNFNGEISSIELLTTFNERTGVTESWDVYDSLFLIPYNARGFTYRKTETGIQLFFGNGIVGKQAPPGQLCKIILGTTRGSDGNVISGSITSTDRLYVKDYDPNGKIQDKDSEGNPIGQPYIMRPVNMTVINTEPAQNGVDAPTIDDIRTGALASIKTLGRLVTKDDYDQMEIIVPGLPIYHSKHVLKRSDIKSNEITVFADLIFNNAIVPTRCSVWEINENENPDFQIYVSDTIMIANELYYSMFNISIQPDTKTCNYYYLAVEAEEAVTMNRTYSVNPITLKPETKLLPTYTTFRSITTDEYGIALDNDDQKLRIEIRYDKIIDDDYSSLGCYIITDWDGMTYTMSRDLANVGTQDEYEYFYIEFDLKDVHEGEWVYYFKMYELIEDISNPGEYIPSFINESQVKMIIKQNLDEYMYSQVQVTGIYPNRTVSIYNVPLIKKNYYDSIDQNIFKKQVYNKLLTFDVTSYRMITDFLNLKFSDTTGPMTNMQLNKATKEPVIDINIPEIPTLPSNMDRYIITSDDSNPWIVNPWNRRAPFIASYRSSSSNWVFEKIDTNDIIFILNEGKKMVFNSEKMVDPQKTIPFEIHLVVWKDVSHPSSESGLIQNIKDNLIEGMYREFGFDKTVYRSTIVDIVKSTPGVKNCQILKPNHDIWFSFDIYRDLSQQELLEYTPQLIFMDSTNITVEVR